MNSHEGQAGELLWRVADTMLHLPFADSGRAPAMFSAREAILKVLLGQPEGVMLKELSRLVRRTAGAVSQSIELLVREGLVERTVSDRDRRVVLVKPTERCVVIWRRHMACMNAMVAEALKAYHPRNRKLFVDILEDITIQLHDTAETMQEEQSAKSNECNPPSCIRSSTLQLP